MKSLKVFLTFLRLSVFLSLLNFVGLTLSQKVQMMKMIIWAVFLMSSMEQHLQVTWSSNPCCIFPYPTLLVAKCNTSFLFLRHFHFGIVMQWFGVRYPMRFLWLLEQIWLNSKMNCKVTGLKGGKQWAC